MNPPDFLLLHDLVDWLRERYTPSPEGWWDVDMSEEEEVAAVGDGRPNPSAPYTPEERETLTYLARVRAARAAQLARHRRGFWNAAVWLLVGVVWSSGALVELVRSPARGLVLLGSGILVASCGFVLGRRLITESSTASRRAARDG
jgi:hypothetical protein